MISCYCLRGGWLPELRGNNKWKNQTCCLPGEFFIPPPTEFIALCQQKRQREMGLLSVIHNKHLWTSGWLYVKSHKRHNCCCFGFLLFCFSVCLRKLFTTRSKSVERNDTKERGAEIITIIIIKSSLGLFWSFLEISSKALASYFIFDLEPSSSSLFLGHEKCLNETSVGEVAIVAHSTWHRSDRSG